MANQLYGGLNPSSYAGAATSVYSSSRSAAAAVDPYLPSEPSLRYHLGGANSISSLSSHPSSYSDRVSSMLFNHQTDSSLKYSSAVDYSAATARVSGAAATETSHLVPSQAASWSVTVDPTNGGIKRPSEMLYHQTLLGAYNTIGQSDAWYTTNPLAKRTRFETGGNLSIYPQRPGEKDCAHYMLTRTCKFGDSCKFDHPIWVPEGGIPDWKEVPLDATTGSFPERPGEADCPYFLKTQKCKYGFRCKFNHPKDKALTLDTNGSTGFSNLPDRPSEPPCAYYMKTGICKFGATCKFHHPKDIQFQPAAQNKPIEGHDVTPALFHNSKGLPIRLGVVDCPFYLKTGSCKYGATCRYNHPDRMGFLPTAAVGHNLMPSTVAHLNMGVVNPAASLLQTIDPRFTQTALGLAPTVYPQRPGQTECDYYMKTGECKFGERCRFHHPIDRSASTLSTTEAQQNVKLTLAGLPRREGSVHCPYYMKTGACKFGASCKFDHPPPGEVMATATSVGEGKEDGEQQPPQ